jgi:hypothetical protein
MKAHAERNKKGCQTEYGPNFNLDGKKLRGN